MAGAWPTEQYSMFSHPRPGWGDALLAASRSSGAAPATAPALTGGDAWAAWDAAPVGGIEALRQRRFKLELICAVINRRARVAAAVAVAAGHAAEAAATGGSGPQGPKTTPSDTFTWADHVARLTEAEFKLRYRVTPHAFHKELLPKLWSRLSLDPKVRVKHERKHVEPEVKLAICLRYMAGGDPLDLKLIYKVSRSYIYHCVWLGVDAINEVLGEPFPLHDSAKLDRLEREFRAASRGGIWTGQVGAVDGVHFPMRAPTKKDVSKPMRYYVQRKGEYALLCMAVCDAARRLTFFDISQEPTTHDSLAWLASDLGKKLDAGLLLPQYHFNGDAAFSPSVSMMTPSGNDPELDDYDFHQSSNRMPIECAFGILIRRFACLYKPLQCAFHRRTSLIAACIHMHNFCIDQRIHDESTDVDGITEVQPNRWAPTPLFDKHGRPVDALDIERGPPVRGAEQRPAKADDPRFAKRYALAAVIEERGLHREGLPLGVERRVRKKRGRVAGKRKTKQAKS